MLNFIAKNLSKNISLFYIKKVDTLVGGGENENRKI